MPEEPVLTCEHRRMVTSFYSNLVTRPTGRAVRMGVESQLAELDGMEKICLSVLDFSQVHVLDYSCADEIVAKLLLRYLGDDRPSNAYFIARGLQEHHLEAVEAVLERHGLLLVAQDEDGRALLLGPSNPFERACWSALARRGCAPPRELAGDAGLPDGIVAPILARLARQRVMLRSGPDLLFDLTHLASES
jgi:hypothetical protein